MDGFKKNAPAVPRRRYADSATKSAQNGPSKFCGEGLMLRAERTWRGRYLRVTSITPLTFYPEWMVQVAHQGAGAPQVHGGLARAPLPGTTYAEARWSTLAYVEKVR